MERRPHYIYLLLLCLSAGGALRVTVWPSLVSGLRGRDVSIVCDVSELNLNRPIDLVWKRNVRGVSTDVYYYHNGEVKKSTPRYHVTTEEIRNGNATLHISALQVADEGQYTCDIINTPNQGEGSSTLQVSAPPSVTVTPEDPRIEPDTEISAMCKLTGFYPQAVTILWVRHHKHSPGYDILQMGKCTTDPEMNSDGTFNIISHLILRPQIEDKNRYSCIVTHRSLEEAIMRSFTLTVIERDITGIIAGWVIGTIIGIFLPVMAASYYLITVKKYSPTVSEITVNVKLIHLVSVLLMIEITNYRPEELIIDVFLKRSGEQKSQEQKSQEQKSGEQKSQEQKSQEQKSQEQKSQEQKSQEQKSQEQKSQEQKSQEQKSQEQKETHIFTWRSRDPTCLTRMMAARGDNVRAVLLDMQEPTGTVNGEHKNRPLQLEMFPVTSRKRFGLCSCMCVLRIIPDYDTDNDAELSLRVEHPATKSEVYVRRTLRVVGVAPVMEPIQNIRNAVIAGKDLTLTCMIHSFYPSKIQVKWYTEDRKEIDSHTRELHRTPKNLHQSFSSVTFTPTKSDKGKTFCCEVRHETLEAPISATWTLSELRE